MMTSQVLEQHDVLDSIVGRTAPASSVFVRRLHAFYPLQAHEAAAVAALIKDVATIPSHHEILPEGRPAREAVVLLEGLACHYQVLDTGRRQMTGFIVPGDLCDFGFLSSSPVRQSVMALGASTIGRIDLDQLSALADKLPNIIVAAMRGASIQQASARELVISLGARDAMQRMAHCLCEIYTRLKVVGLVSSSGQFDLALTQAELGEALGLSTVHVNRTIQQLRKQKLITLANAKVTILDFSGLAALASFDGQYLLPN